MLDWGFGGRAEGNPFWQPAQTHMYPILAAYKHTHTHTHTHTHPRLAA